MRIVSPCFAGSGSFGLFCGWVRGWVVGAVVVLGVFEGIVIFVLGGVLRVAGVGLLLYGILALLIFRNFLVSGN